MPGDDLLRFEVVLHDDDVDEARLARMTNALCAELNGRQLGTFTHAKDERPQPGSMGLDALWLGTLAVGLLPDALPAFLDVMRGWRRGGRQRSIRIRVRQGSTETELEVPESVLDEKDIEQVRTTLRRLLG